MPLLRRGRRWYVRITAPRGQVWRSMRTTRRPSPALVARVESELWREAGKVRRDPDRLPPTTPAARTVEEFLDWIKANRSASYHRRIAWSLRDAARVIDRDDLAEWTRDRIEAWLAGGQRTRSWSGATRNRHLAMIGRFLVWAQRRGLLQQVPTRAIERSREERVQPRYMTVEQISALLEAARENDGRRRDKRAAPLEAAFRIALGTGARISELVALRWEDVDRAAGRVRLIPGKGKVGRSVPISPMTASGLAMLRQGRPEGQVLRGLPPNSVRCRTVFRAAKIPKGGWHLCRHTFCSHLAMQGVPATVIQALAGHESPLTTMRYVHLMQGATDKALENLTYAAPVAAIGSRST